MTFKSLFKAWINMPQAIAGRDAAIDRMRFDGASLDIGQRERTKPVERDCPAAAVRA